MVIAKYIRLSQADRDLLKKENKTESESISHQRNLIQRYIDANPALRHCKQYEFLDDGYSGTNFARPGFERLIKSMEQGEINCIVVKDFSRFGRNYIELGDYLERVFPLLGVRFISVNDHYDSADYKGTTGGIDIAMKNMVYDFYSKDLSVKVSTAKRTKMQQGLYCGGHVPYGLKKHDTIKGKLVIDEESAVIVRKIFEYALGGTKTTEIARILNEEQVPTPGQYYIEKHPATKKFQTKNKEVLWTTTSVRKILQQEMYYGAVVGHRRENVSPCSKVTKAVPKEEQIIMEGMHEAIVTKEEWLQAQNVIHSIERTKQNKKRIYPLKGKARCGYCGRALSYEDKRKTKYFRCCGTYGVNDSPCTKTGILVEPIEETVKNALMALFETSNELEREIRKKSLQREKASIHRKEQKICLQKEIEKKEMKLFEYMDQLNEGLIEKEIFLKQKNQIKSEIESVRAKIRELEQEKQRTEMIEEFEKKQFVEKVRSFQEEELSMEMVQTFIETVKVFDNEHIEIQWKFTDEIMGGEAKVV